MCRLAPTEGGVDRQLGQAHRDDERGRQSKPTLRIDRKEVISKNC